MKSNMGTLTAAKWQHWTLVSSGYCLHGLIPPQYLAVWEHFVTGCRLLSPACIHEKVLGKVELRNSERALHNSLEVPQ